MIVADSSVWVDYFNGTPTIHADRLDSALRDEEDLAVVPIVVTEVLCGFRSQSGFERARSVLTKLPCFTASLACHVRAATMYRTLRFRGITVRGGIDCVIAQVCIDAGATLLSPDTDFRLIADNTALNLWSPPP